MANYLYNGVELPELPEWDKTAYPYAILYIETLASYNLFLTEVPLCAFYNDYLNRICYKPTNDCTLAYYRSNDTGWTYKGEVSIVANEFYCDSLGAPWTNHDILNEDGSIAFATSDPIPVGGESLDPTSMTMGWLVGQAIRK